MTHRLNSFFAHFTAIFCISIGTAAHNFGPNGICTDEGCQEPYQPPVLEDGWYLLANAGNVEWFSAKVNAGGNDISLCGKMNCDIDFTNVSHTPIGSSEATKFNGRFDGQGHRILNLKMRSTSDLQGFFGGLRGGGTTVRNLVLDQSCTITGKQRVGGIAAFAQTTGTEPIVIEGCINEASVTGTSTAVGGILGGSMSPHPAIHIRNCINRGTVRGSGESATIAGWLGDNGASVVENCFNTGRLIGIDASKRNMVRHGGVSVVRNIYEFYNSSTYTQGRGTEWSTESPLSGGELCYRLSLGQGGRVWRQTLGQDDVPLPFSGHADVFLCGKASCDGSPKRGASYFSNVDEGLTIEGHQFRKGHCMVCGALQEGYNFPPRKVFLMAGQSNADGRSAISTMPDYIQQYAATGSKFCLWSYANGTDAAWKMFGGRFSPYMPYTDNNALTRCGFDGILWHMLEEELGERFFVIKESRGGTAIDPRCTSTDNLWWCASDEWLASAAPRSGHSLALELTENIGLLIDNVLSELAEGYDIRCIVWHQGESDRTQAEAYHDNLQQLVAYLRAYLASKTGQPDYLTLPFIAGTVNRSSTQYNATVERALYQLETEDENFHVVDMHDCRLGSDNLHFDATGCAVAAQRVFQKMQSLGLLDDASPTGLQELRKAGDKGINAGAYDLEGKASNMKLPGIYITDGRKVSVGGR